MEALATHMRIVVLQACGFEHFLAGAKAAAARYPQARLVGFVREEDLPAARASGAFAEVQPLPSDAEQYTAEDILGRPIDLCVLPFESRLGVYCWNFRRIPIRHKIPAVAIYNGLGQFREWSRLGWIVNSLVISVGLRSVHKSVLWVWGYLGRWLDIAAVFLLAGTALAVHGLRTLITSLFDLKTTMGLPAGRRRAVLFIPVLGVGGSQKQLVTFLQHLDRDRLDVELVMLDLPDKFFEPDVRALGIRITYLNRHREVRMAGVVWRLMRHLRAHPCHVLHGWMHYAAALGAIAGRLADVPVVIGSLRSERPGRFPWFYSRWQRPLDMLTAHLHDTIIANSKAVREDNRRWALIPERKLMTVYNGIDVDKTVLVDQAQLDRLCADLGLPPHAPVVGIVGRLWPEKDHATFLKAARLISEARPETQFLIVGDGNLRQWIESEIGRLGLTGRVHVLGDRKDALALIQLLAVLVLTSTSEGFPNVLLEAAVAGTTVVTTAAGGATEVVLDAKTGFVVPCGDAEAVAGRVLELLGDADLRKRLAGAARDRIRTCFSADRAASAIQSLYEQGLHRNGTSASIRPLRVCFISTFAYGVLKPSSGLSVGGAEVQMCSLARALARDLRFDITVLAGDRGRVGKERQDAMTIVLSPLFRDLQVAAGAQPAPGTVETGRETGWEKFVRLLRGRLNRLPSNAAGEIRWLIRKVYSSWVVRCAREWYEFARWVRQLYSVNSDIYVMRCASPQVGSVKLACEILRRKLVYMVSHDDEIAGQYVLTRGDLRKRFEWGLRRADVVVCQHADQVGMLRSRYRQEGRLIRSLCPTLVRSRSDAHRKTILWIGRMDPWKQPDLFIELAARMPEETFAMVGPPSPIAPDNLLRLQKLAAAVPNLCLSAGVPFERTEVLFAEAKLFVNTSRDEGFPNTFLQAAACGTPIVSWAVNPEGILDRHQIGYCANQDWARFEQCVRLLCADEALRVRMGDNGRRYVQEHHDPAAIAAQYAELFFTLRDGRPSGPAGSGGGSAPRAWSGGTQ